jgi:hypothetical protein
MDLIDARFMKKSEPRRGEMAVTAQHLMAKEAQRAWMKIPPLLGRSCGGYFVNHLDDPET